MSRSPLPHRAPSDPGDGVEIDPAVWVPPFVSRSERVALAVSMRTPELVRFDPPPVLRGDSWRDPLPTEADYACTLTPADTHPVLAGLIDPLLDLDDLDALENDQKPDVAAHAVHEWGGTTVEELAYLALGASQHDVVHRVSVAVDQRLMVSVAKLMAARVLMANVACKASLVAITSGYRQTAFAAHNNRTRATIATAAAFLSGADLVATPTAHLGNGQASTHATCATLSTWAGSCATRPRSDSPRRPLGAADGRTPPRSSWLKRLGHDAAKSERATSKSTRAICPPSPTNSTSPGCSHCQPSSA